MALPTEREMGGVLHNVTFAAVKAYRSYAGMLGHAGRVERQTLLQYVQHNAVSFAA